MHAAGTPKGVYNMVQGPWARWSARQCRGHPGHRHDVVHRLDPRRHPRGRGSPSRSAASPRSWAASRPQHPAAGRRLPDGGHQGHQQHEVSELGPVLHGSEPHVRAAGSSRQKVQGRSPRRPPSASWSATRRIRHELGPVVDRSPVQQDLGLIQKGASTKRGTGDRRRWPSGEPEPRLLCGASTCVFAGVTNRHDDRAREMLPDRSSPSFPTRTRKRSFGWPTTRSAACRLRAGHRSRARPQGAPRRCGPATST